MKFEKSFDDEKTSFSSKRCAKSSQLHCSAFRYRTNSNMIMACNAMLNSTDTTRFSTFLMFLLSYRSNTIKNWKFREPIKTSYLLKTPRKLLAVEVFSDSILSHCTHISETLPEISYSVGLDKLMPFNVFYQHNSNELGVKLQFLSFGENLSFQEIGVQTLCYLNILRFDIKILKSCDVKLIKFLFQISLIFESASNNNYKKVLNLTIWIRFRI